MDDDRSPEALAEAFDALCRKPWSPTDEGAMLAAFANLGRALNFKRESSPIKLVAATHCVFLRRRLFEAAASLSANEQDREASLTILKVYGALDPAAIAALCRWITGLPTTTCRRLLEDLLPGTEMTDEEWIDAADEFLESVKHCQDKLFGGRYKRMSLPEATFEAIRGVAGYNVGILFYALAAENLVHTSSLRYQCLKGIVTTKYCRSNRRLAILLPFCSSGCQMVPGYRLSLFADVSELVLEAPHQLTPVVRTRFEAVIRSYFAYFPEPVATMELVELSHRALTLIEKLLQKTDWPELHRLRAQLAVRSTQVDIRRRARSALALQLGALFQGGEHVIELLEAEWRTLFERWLTPDRAVDHSTWTEMLSVREEQLELVAAATLAGRSVLAADIIKGMFADRENPSVPNPDKVVAWYCRVLFKEGQDAAARAELVRVLRADLDSANDQLGRAAASGLQELVDWELAQDEPQVSVLQGLFETFFDTSGSGRQAALQLIIGPASNAEAEGQGKASTTREGLFADVSRLRLMPGFAPWINKLCRQMTRDILDSCESPDEDTDTSDPVSPLPEALLHQGLKLLGIGHVWSQDALVGVLERCMPYVGTSTAERGGGKQKCLIECIKTLAAITRGELLPEHGATVMDHLQIAEARTASPHLLKALRDAMALIRSRNLERPGTEMMLAPEQPDNARGIRAAGGIPA